MIFRVLFITFFIIHNCNTAERSRKTEKAREAGKVKSDSTLEEKGKNKGTFFERIRPTRKVSPTSNDKETSLPTVTSPSRSFKCVISDTRGRSQSFTHTRPGTPIASLFFPSAASKSSLDTISHEEAIKQLRLLEKETKTLAKKLKFLADRLEQNKNTNIKGSTPLTPQALAAHNLLLTPTKSPRRPSSAASSVSSHGQ